MISFNSHQNFIKIEIFPNPAKENFVINVLDYNAEKMHLELFNLTGKRILIQRLFEGSNGIELGSVSSGVFVVKIFEQGRLVKSEKLIRL
ncbi:MAG: T9SS type A sorting domain-containing protein [Saprospiraceae bacterium]|nr:T9SS type A sorting domain-containing protein [Saprospiraceae bacterium]